MRLEVPGRIHHGHQGITKCRERERAKQVVWWPGLSRQIQDMVEPCHTCAKHRINKPEPLCPSPFPERLWQVSETDLFYSQSVDYLLAVDYFSQFVAVAPLRKNKTVTEVIRALKAIFARNGIPEKVRSDNGLPFDSTDYTHFATKWGFEISPSSPRYPQSNGEAERAVQTVTNILKKEKDKELAMLAYRSTSLPTGYSPAELLIEESCKTPCQPSRSSLIQIGQIWNTYKSEKPATSSCSESTSTSVIKQRKTPTISSRNRSTNNH